MVRGADPLEVLRISETGWIFEITELTNDAYGTVIIEFQGADLELRTWRINPEGARSVGAFMQDPAGWAQRYLRPNPFSTAGAFYLAVSSGYQGSLWPYVPTVIIKLHLPEDSTQSSAYIRGVAGAIVITDKVAFIRSLRRVWDPKASLKISPALLAVGPAEFREVKP